MIGSKKCLLVIEDDVRMRRGIKDFLTSQNYIVLEAGDGEEGISIFQGKNNEIDLILLDVMMPKKDGYSTLVEIREMSSVPIIMLTAKDGEADQLKGFKNGVDDYITKPFSSSLLSARIEAILKRVGKLGESLLVIEDMKIDLDKKIVLIDRIKQTLTSKEFDLLVYFTRNIDKALSREMILNYVWSFNYIGDGRTLDTHIKQLRVKIKSSKMVIETVFGVGYRFVVKS